MAYRGALILVFVALIPRTSSALELLDNDELKVVLQGWAQAGYQVVVGPGAKSADHEPYLGLARIFLEGKHERWGRAFVHVEGNTGTVELLDVVGELTPIRPLAVRFGKFKNPTSADFLIAGPYTPFVNRALLVEYVQKRLLGAEAVGTLSLEPWKASLQLGWFLPRSEDRTLLPDGDGGFFSARALISHAFGLSLHLAYSELLLADNTPVVPPDAPGDPARRPITYDRLLDAALIYQIHGWTAYLEGLVSLDGPESETPFAFYVMALKSFKLPDRDFSLEPGLRYDLARTDDRTRHRVTAGLTLYLVGDFLNTSVNYELAVDKREVGHAAYAQIQAGF